MWLFYADFTHHAKIWMGIIFPIYVHKRFTSRFTHLKLSIFIVQPDPISFAKQAHRNTLWKIFRSRFAVKIVVIWPFPHHQAYIPPLRKALMPHLSGGWMVRYAAGISSETSMDLRPSKLVFQPTKNGTLPTSWSKSNIWCQTTFTMDINLVLARWRALMSIPTRQDRISCGFLVDFRRLSWLWLRGFGWLQGEPPKIAQVVYKSNNYGLWYANNYSNWGESKPTYNWGASHCRNHFLNLGNIKWNPVRGWTQKWKADGNQGTCSWITFPHLQGSQPHVPRHFTSCYLVFIPKWVLLANKIRIN